MSTEGKSVTRENIRAFYSLPQVRARIVEYLGASEGCGASCVYVAQPDQGWPRLDAVRPPSEVDVFLADGLDVSRSLWDRRDLIAHLDMEYVNFEFPDEHLYDPQRAFQLQEPVCSAVERLLEQHGIVPLHIVSCRGHHYSWRIGRQTEAFGELRELGRCNATLLGRYRDPGIAFAGAVPPDQGYAFAGLGLVLEYLAGVVKSQAAPESVLPVELTAVSVGPGARGREMVSLDVSEYGDPLYLRVIRIPFTAYLKNARYQPYAPEGDSARTVTSVVPAGTPPSEVSAGLRRLDEAADLAQHVSARIPDCSEGMRRLTASYRASELRCFHDQFYAEEQHAPDAWDTTYDRFELSLLPPCIAAILLSPNDLLLKPAGIELVVRALLGLGWHPRHIAGFIRSHYERDYGWCDQWLLHDAATRADFYTRIFAGLFASGVDDLVDFNCCSIREKGFCIEPEEGCRVAALKASLMERRTDHGRLADRSLNRLLF
jgi:hypothetical protein